MVIFTLTRQRNFSMPIEVHILNDRPVVMTSPSSVEKDPDATIVYTVEASDPDGVERVQINLGVFTPIGGQTWAMMHDDGVNGGDEVAGDGVYSVVLSVREGTPLGTHEVSLRAFDTYGELNPICSCVLALAEPRNRFSIKSSSRSRKPMIPPTEQMD